MSDLSLICILGIIIRCRYGDLPGVCSTAGFSPTEVSHRKQSAQGEKAKNPQHRQAFVSSCHQQFIIVPLVCVYRHDAIHVKQLRLHSRLSLNTIQGRLYVNVYSRGALHLATEMVKFTDNKIIDGKNKERTKITKKKKR